MPSLSARRTSVKAPSPKIVEDTAAILSQIGEVPPAGACVKALFDAHLPVRVPWHLHPKLEVRHQHSVAWRNLVKDRATRLSIDVGLKMSLRFSGVRGRPMKVFAIPEIATPCFSRSRIARSRTSVTRPRSLREHVGFFPSCLSASSVAVFLRKSIVSTRLVTV